MKINILRLMERVLTVRSKTPEFDGIKASNKIPNWNKNNSYLILLENG